MQLESIRKVSVIGAGTMGAQIAELMSRAGGYQVTLCDIEDSFIQRGLEGIKNRLNNFFVAKGKMTSEQYNEIVDRISTTTNVAIAARDAHVVVEAIVEKIDLKKEVFRKVDAATFEDSIIVSNTSWLNLTEIANVTQHPERVAGMHFFNPIAVMKLVEVVKAARTSDQTIEIIKNLIIKLGKEPVICKDYSFGFLANRAYRAMRNEAVVMVWERVGSPQEIDKALKLGYGLPMGPLELTDMTGGWKTTYDSEDFAIRELGGEAGRVHPLIKMMVRAGYTGGAGKKGIYAFWEDVLTK